MQGHSFVVSNIPPFQVVHNLVSDAYGEQTPVRSTLHTVPNDSLEEFWLDLKSFNVSKTSKSGCGGFKNIQTSWLIFSYRINMIDFSYIIRISMAISSWFNLSLVHTDTIGPYQNRPLALPDYPQNVQVATHFREFLRGYRSSAEAVQCKFPVVDGSRAIQPATVGISDGFNKVLIMYGITLICHHLDPWSYIGIANFGLWVPP